MREEFENSCYNQINLKYRFSLKHKLASKISSNLETYKQDIRNKGIYWSLVYRLYKLPMGRRILTPIVNALKPNHIMINNHKFYIDKHDTAVSQELLLSGKWEEYETGLFKKRIKSGDIVIDIGAHIGYYTLIAAHLVGNKGKVYAFEPDSKNFGILKRNIEENGYKNVILVNKAVTDFSRETNLFLNNENTGDHRIYNSEDKRKSVTVRTVTLDEFFRNKAKRVDLIKMDIQGSEMRAFKGGQKIIKMNKNIIIFTEFWPQGLELSGNSAEEYVRLLTKNMFQIYNINENNKTIGLLDSKELLLPLSPTVPDERNLMCIKAKK